MSNEIINYGKHYVDNEDIQAVIDVLENDPLSCGPHIKRFENDLKEYTGFKHCRVTNSGTAALHTALLVLKVGEFSKEDEIIVPCLSFIATASVVKYTGAKVVFCDIEKDTGLIDIDKLIPLINKNTKGIICVDYAGQSCNYDLLSKICNEFNLPLIIDACHSLGAINKDTKKYSNSIVCYSFHPVKHITTGEGGAILTNNEKWDIAAKHYINHGRHNVVGESRNIVSSVIGYNYRMPNINAALGITQLKKLDVKIKRLLEIAKRYRKEIKETKDLTHMKVKNIHVYHTFVIKVSDREKFMDEMLNKNIKCVVLYDAIYDLIPYETEKNEAIKNCQNMETIKYEIVSIPIYYGLNDEQVSYIINSVNEVVEGMK